MIKRVKVWNRSENEEKVAEQKYDEEEEENKEEEVMIEKNI